MTARQLGHVQAGPLTDRAVHLLMSQPGFWRAISGCFKAIAPGTAARAADATTGQEAEVWQLQTEAAALQLLVVQVHACTLPGGPPLTPPCHDSSFLVMDTHRAWSSSAYVPSLR